MRQEMIMELNNKVINEEMFSEIELSECVSCTDLIGSCSSHSNCNWISIEFVDGDSIDVYLDCSEVYEQENCEDDREEEDECSNDCYHCNQESLGYPNCYLEETGKYAK
jgi:hypothetical protein